MVSAIELLIQRWALRHRHPFPAPITDSADVFFFVVLGWTPPAKPSDTREITRSGNRHLLCIWARSPRSTSWSPHTAHRGSSNIRGREGRPELPACLPRIDRLHLHSPLPLLRSLVTSTKLTGDNVRSGDTRQVMFQPPPLARSSDSNFEMALECASGDVRVSESCFAAGGVSLFELTFEMDSEI